VSYNLTKGDFRRLLQWQRRMVTLFVYTWIYILLVVAVHIFFRPKPEIVQLALVPVLGLVLAGAYIQFSVRCPSCGYRLGRQSRLSLRDCCGRCGIPLRSSDAAP
jgi:hypothetical protein